MKKFKKIWPVLRLVSVVPILFFFTACPQNINDLDGLKHAFKNGGHYRLASSFSVNESLTVEASSVILRGDNTTLTFNYVNDDAVAITVKKGCTLELGLGADNTSLLTIEDNPNGKMFPTLIKNNGNLNIYKQATLKSTTLWGETIINDGNLTLNGGEIFGYCNIVTNNSGGTFTMDDGKIQGDTKHSDGNGIFNYGTFTMNGGTISGAGVGLQNVGPVTMTGGKICGNIIYDVYNIFGSTFPTEFNQTGGTVCEIGSELGL